MPTTTESLARPHSRVCAGGCGSTWNGNKTWVTCWMCPGAPLALCPGCGKKHFATEACQKAHGAGGGGGAGG